MTKSDNSFGKQDRLSLLSQFTQTGNGSEQECGQVSADALSKVPVQSINPPVERIPFSFFTFFFHFLFLIIDIDAGGTEKFQSAPKLSQCSFTITTTTITITVVKRERG